MSPAPTQAAQAGTIVRYALRESFRRRLLPVVAALTLAFLVLYALGAHFAFREVGDAGRAGGVGFGEDIDDRALAGATLMGLAMFGTLFLGAVLTTFLTLGVIRGDAEAGLMQPIAARPISRPTLLGARCLGAALVSAVYVIVVFFLSVAITSVIGDWAPDRPVQAALLLAAAVVVITCLSALASAFVSSTAQGVTVLMLFGAGLTAGLLGQIGDALGSDGLVDISEFASRALPFEALYQDALYALTADVSGTTGFLLSLGPFGGAVNGGVGLLLWSTIYCAGVLAIAAWVFSRRDI
jgi:ABC-type transport system involved in multi-copper enzyme maturation permease subunit